MLMYGGLLILAGWRGLCFYRCCGFWLSILNYTSLLYLILTASLVYSTVLFYKMYQQPLVTAVHPDAQIWSVGWLRPFVLGSPVAVCLSVLLCWFQTEGHVFEIHKDTGTLKHDRAVQIIALPSVFAVMAMASMVPMYELVTGNIDEEMLQTPFGVDIRMRFGQLQGTSMLPNVTSPIASTTQRPSAPSSIYQASSDNWQEKLDLALWRYETCFYVGDLFEAWALYQFGKLALELIRESFERQANSEHEAERQAARELLASHSAVTSLTWLGTSTFVIVCVGQTACSLWPYIGGSTNGAANLMLQFQVAGFVASGAAIYNVFVVERAFHPHLVHSSPLLKFLSVKILVSLSFFQRGTLVLLQTGNKLLPDMVQKIVGYLPLVGDLLNLTQVQLHLFYPALILYECFMSAIMHLWAWKPNEAWYAADLDDVAGSERQPLLAKPAEGDA